MTFALGITSLVYVLIALGVFGTLTADPGHRLRRDRDRRGRAPALGDAGFTIMAIVALLSTAGSTNATLYASGNLTACWRRRPVPGVLRRGIRLGRHAGLLITSALVLLVANLVDLSAIASVGSAVSLMVFLLVGIAGWRRRADTAATRIVLSRSP